MSSPLAHHRRGWSFGIAGEVPFRRPWTYQWVADWRGLDGANGHRAARAPPTAAVVDHQWARRSGEEEELASGGWWVATKAAEAAKAEGGEDSGAWHRSQRIA